MRNSTALHLLAAVALAALAGLLVLPAGGIQAAPLEDTESGAPAASVIFPVSAKPNSGGLGMKPVVFNHKIHEKNVATCESCHHTGDPVACTTCHTVEGKTEGKFVKLDRAMHATNIKQRKGNTPKSCVSCHAEQFAKPECAGCHTLVKPSATRGQEWCNVCHAGVKDMTKTEMQKGSAGKLDQSDNEALAATALAEKAKKAEQEKGPYRVSIGTLSKQYEPCLFNHRRHVASLSANIEQNSLAQAFHNGDKATCTACHHRSPASATPPSCSSCHSEKVDPKTPDRPTLKAAYHLQCMDCHRAMNVARPANTDCKTCHKKRAQ